MFLVQLFSKSCVPHAEIYFDFLSTLVLSVEASAGVS
jgi:hypothetical protein